MRFDRKIIGFFMVVLTHGGGVPVYSAGPPPDDLIGIGFGAQIRLCEEMLNDPRAREVANRIGFAALKMANLAGLITYPEDQLIIRLANSPTDPLFKRLSSKGAEELSHFFRQEVSWPRVQNVLERGPGPIDARTSDLSDFYAARDREDWDKAIRLYFGLNPLTRDLTAVRQQYALVLNRRNDDSDRATAIFVLNSLVREERDLGETLGILSRVHRDRYRAFLAQAEGREHTEEGQSSIRLATRQLDLAIEAAVRGFWVDFKSARPRDDMYPAGAALALLNLRGTVESLQRAHDVASMVRLFMNDRDRKVDGKAIYDVNFWAAGTYLNALIVLRDWNEISRLVPIMLKNAGGKMPLRTTGDAVAAIAEGWQKMDADDLDEFGIEAADFERLSWVTRQFHRAAESFSVTEAAVTPTEPRRFSTVEPALDVTRLNRPELIVQAGIEPEIDTLTEHARIITFEEFMLHKASQQKGSTRGFLLGATGEYHSSLAAVAELTGLTPWWKAYNSLGIPMRVRNTPQFMDALIARNEPIVMLVPDGLLLKRDANYTHAEYRYLVSESSRMKNLTVVLGAHRVMQLDFTRPVDRRRGQTLTKELMKRALQTYQSWLLEQARNAR